MAISTINQNGLNAPLTLTSPVLNSPAFSGTPTGTLVSANMPTGSVLQVVTGTTSGGVTNSTNVYVDTGLTATITPKFSTSKILVVTTMVGVRKSAGHSDNRIGFKLFRGATQLDQSLANLWTQTATMMRITWSHSYIDLPASTSALTYKWQFANEQNTAEVNVQTDSNSGTSQITLMEIAG